MAKMFSTVSATQSKQIQRMHVKLSAIRRTVAARGDKSTDGKFLGSKTRIARHRMLDMMLACEVMLPELENLLTDLGSSECNDFGAWENEEAGKVLVSHYDIFDHPPYQQNESEQPTHTLPTAATAQAIITNDDVHDVSEVLAQHEEAMAEREAIDADDRLAKDPEYAHFEYAQNLRAEVRKCEADHDRERDGPWGEGLLGTIDAAPQEKQV